VGPALTAGTAGRRDRAARTSGRQGRPYFYTFWIGRSAGIEGPVLFWNRR
jgi:hypothetical protein